MKLTKVTVSASRTFNHPYERYANFRFEIRLEGEVEEGLSIQQQIDSMREEAEANAENHKRQILADLELERERDLLVGDINRVSRLDRSETELTSLDPEVSEWMRDQARACLNEIDALPELRAKLEAMPKPRLLPEMEIHPGHPDHPNTEDIDFDFP